MQILLTQVVINCERKKSQQEIPVISPISINCMVHQESTNMYHKKERLWKSIYKCNDEYSNDWFLSNLFDLKNLVYYL